MYKKMLIGLSAGLISGFLGTGGGMILVPGLIYILKNETVEARATSVCCILPMVITSSFFYYKSNFIDWNISLLCAIGGIIGGTIGANFLSKIPEIFLKLIFLCILLYSAYRMIL